jgi:hypothetical protein
MKLMKLEDGPAACDNCQGVAHWIITLSRFRPPLKLCEGCCDLLLKLFKSAKEARGN